MTDKRPSPFTLRLTAEERARLERDASDMPIGAYVKSRLFDPAQDKRKTQNKRPVQDYTALAQILGLLGQSEVPVHIRQLARAVETGTLIVTPETEQELKDAARYVGEIRNLLIKGLGLKV